jgi:hypothetical protein
MKPLKYSKELIGAVAEEEKRQAIDAAKKKAVAQHADYDTFKKMVRVPSSAHQALMHQHAQGDIGKSSWSSLLLLQVSVAHLKPLHASGGQGFKGISFSISAQWEVFHFPFPHFQSDCQTQSSL